MTTIRRIRVDEAPTVRGLYARMVDGEARKYPEDRIAISERGLDNFETYFRLGAAHQDLFTLVAEEDETIVGFVLAEVTRSPGLPGLAGEILELSTLPGADETLAADLVEEAVRQLRDRGVGPIFHYEDASHPERRPWESLGFEADVVRFSLYANGTS
jgi:hypothetical protein